MSTADPNSGPSTGIRLYRSDWHECNYLDGRSARTLFIDPHLAKDSLLYGQLQKSGFRRSGNDIYRPDCGPCRDCMPARLPVSLFKPRRRHRRLLKKNDPQFTISWDNNPQLTEEYFELYQRYMASRHADSDMANPSQLDFEHFLICAWGDSRFLRVHHHDTLVAVAVTDFTSGALSAVYTFYHPEYERSGLGVYCVLKQISEAQRMGMQWLYLGFWVPNCRKMEYKIEYRPTQLLINDHWTDYGIDDTPPTSGNVTPEYP